MALAKFISETSLRREISGKIKSALNDLEYLRRKIAEYQEGCDGDAGNFDAMKIRSSLGKAESYLINYIFQQIINRSEILYQHPTREEIDLCLR